MKLLIFLSMFIFTLPAYADEIRLYFPEDEAVSTEKDEEPSTEKDEESSKDMIKIEDFIFIEEKVASPSGRAP